MKVFLLETHPDYRHCIMSESCWSFASLHFARRHRQGQSYILTDLMLRIKSKKFYPVYLTLAELPEIGGGQTN